MPAILRFWENLEGFQTDPPILHSFLEMTPHKLYILWKWPPPCLIAVETIQRIFLLQILPKLTTYFIYMYNRCWLFTAVQERIELYPLFSCYIQFQFMLITALYYFDEMYKIAPQVTLTYLKMTPQLNGRPHLIGNKLPAP